MDKKNNINLWSKNDLEELEKYLVSIFGGKFETKNMELYANALTHISQDHRVNYETLEFLGDRVYGLILSEHIYCHLSSLLGKNNSNVGYFHDIYVEFTNKNFQAHLFDQLGLEKKHLLKYLNGNKIESINVKSDVFEALLGAIFLDKGISWVKKLLNKLFLKKIKDQMILKPMDEEERNLRKKLSIKENQPLIIEYSKNKKRWTCAFTRKGHTYRASDPDLFIARDSLIDMVSSSLK